MIHMRGHLSETWPDQVRAILGADQVSFPFQVFHEPMRGALVNAGGF
jgi:hypothetical protein